MPVAARAGPGGTTTPPRSQWPGSGTSSASSGVTGRLICHQVRTRSKPACRQPARAGARRSANAPVSICWVVQAAGGADRPGLRRPPSRAARRSSASATSSGRSRSTTWTKSIRPSARSWTLPQARISPSASRTTTFSRIRRPALGDLDQDVVDRRRPPSRGRAARGRAAGGSAGRRRTGRPGRACRPPSRPAGPGVSEDAVGVALEPVVIGDHDRRFCRTRGTTPTRPGRVARRRRAVARRVRRASRCGSALPARPARRGPRRAPARARRPGRWPRRRAPRRPRAALPSARGPRARPASARRASALSLRVASAARCWAAVRRRLELAERGLLLVDARPACSANAAFSAVRCVGEVAVGLGLLGPVAGGVAARLQQLGVGDPGGGGAEHHSRGRRRA